MRVLVGCEYSGAVRDAFLALGHDATSCDLLPTDVPGDKAAERHTKQTGHSTITSSTPTRPERRPR